MEIKETFKFRKSELLTACLSVVTALAVYLSSLANKTDAEAKRLTVSGEHSLSDKSINDLKSYIERELKRIVERQREIDLKQDQDIREMRVIQMTKGR